MVTLKNIKKTKDDISADYYIESNSAKGFIRINMSDGKVMELKNIGYGYSHAIREIERLATIDNPPTETTVYWY